MLAFSRLRSVNPVWLLAFRDWVQLGQVFSSWIVTIDNRLLKGERMKQYLKVGDWQELPVFALSCEWMFICEIEGRYHSLLDRPCEDGVLSLSCIHHGVILGDVNQGDIFIQCPGRETKPMEAVKYRLPNGNDLVCHFINSAVKSDRFYVRVDWLCW